MTCRIMMKNRKTRCTSPNWVAVPAVYPMYGSTISDPRLFAFMVQCAEKHEINHQTRQPTSTRNRMDAFHAVHKQLEGIPTLTVSVPGRYPHTAMGVAYKSDIADTIKLLDAALQDLSKEVITR